MAEPWGAYVAGVIGVLGLLAVIELGVLALRLAPRAASGESLD